jgi:D-amino-acid oxidase
VHTGVSFTTFAVNVPRYLGYLLSLVRAHNGVTIPARLPTVAGLEKALAEAKRLVGGREAWAYVNASGIGAKELCGDDTVYALRGQTVLVRGEAKAISTRLGKTANEVRAIIPRPGSGTTIVGVSKEPGVWSTTVSEEMTRSLLEGGRELAPELVDERDGTFGVIGPRVGLRPARRGGARVEAEVLKNGEFVVHEYGHSGAGYQNSIGSASKVLRLVEKSTAGRL